LSPQRGSWAESVGLWDVYAVASADADIDACPQPMMPVVPVHFSRTGPCCTLGEAFVGHLYKTVVWSAFR